MEIRTFDVTDDSGFLAIIDSDGYSGFVDENWNFEQLVTHFQCQMKKHRLLIWETGCEGVWSVEIHFDRVHTQGFQEVIGSLEISEGSLLVTNYEDLTMAAQFEDVKLPEPHQDKQLIRIEPGQYQCRIIQLQDHTYGAENEMQAEGEADYIIELLKDMPLAPVWPSIAWATV